MKSLFLLFAFSGPMIVNQRYLISYPACTNCSTVPNSCEVAELMKHLAGSVREPWTKVSRHLHIKPAHTGNHYFFEIMVSKVTKTEMAHHASSIVIPPVKSLEIWLFRCLLGFFWHLVSSCLLQNQTWNNVDCITPLAFAQ